MECSTIITSRAASAPRTANVIGRGLPPSSHNFVTMWQPSFGVVIFQAHRSLFFLYLFLFSRPACRGSELVLPQRAAADAERTRAR